MSSKIMCVKCIKKESSRGVFSLLPFLGKFCPGNGGQSLIPTEFWQSAYKTSITPNERTNEQTTFVRSDRGFVNWLSIVPQQNMPTKLLGQTSHNSGCLIKFINGHNIRDEEKTLGLNRWADMHVPCCHLVLPGLAQFKPANQARIALSTTLCERVCIWNTSTTRTIS